MLCPLHDVQVLYRLNSCSVHDVKFLSVLVTMAHPLAAFMTSSSCTGCLPAFGSMLLLSRLHIQHHSVALASTIANPCGQDSFVGPPSRRSLRAWTSACGIPGALAVCRCSGGGGAPANGSGQGGVAGHISFANGVVQTYVTAEPLGGE